MLTKANRPSVARIVSFVVLFGIIPLWFFYIGIRFNQTISTVQSNKDATTNYLTTGKQN